MGQNITIAAGTITVFDWVGHFAPSGGIALRHTKGTIVVDKPGVSRVNRVRARLEEAAKLDMQVGYIAISAPVAIALYLEGLLMPTHIGAAIEDGDTIIIKGVVLDNVAYTFVVTQNLGGHFGIMPRTADGKNIQ